MREQASTTPSSPGRDHAGPADPTAAIAPDPTAAAPVVVQVPADKTYVVLIRSTASHLGARLGFTMAEISDLRLAVDEACGLLLLPGGFEITGDEIECRFTEVAGGLHVVVSAQAGPSAEPDTDGFGWSVLGALVDSLRWAHQDGRVHLELSKRPTAKGH